MTDIQALPFDQFQRYRLVADLLASVLGTGPVRVLDVGGRTDRLRSFLKEAHVVLVDVETSDAPGLILGSGAALPFADGSFDAVCAFDTLEHVPSALRDAFVRECARVSKGYVFLAGPYDSPEVARSEELLQEFLKHKIGQPHRYLNEHRELGLPNQERTLDLLREAGGTVGSLGHASLDRWLLAMCLEMYMESDPLLQPLAEPFYRFYNQMVYPHDHGGQVYRHVVMASFGGGELPKSKDVLQAPGVPQETQTLLNTFATDWMAVDREHQVWKPEQQRLTGVIQDLEKDLGEHKETLGVAQQDLDAHKEALRTAQQDLEAHKKTLGALRSEFTALSGESAKAQHELNTELQAQAENARHLEKTLRDQASAGQAAIAELRAHYEGAMDSARKQGESVQQEIGEELARTQAHAQELAGNLGMLQQHIQFLEGEIARAEGVMDDLEGERVRLHGHSEGLEAHVNNLVATFHETEARVVDTEARLQNAEAEAESAKKALASWRQAVARVFGFKYRG